MLHCAIVQSAQLIFSVVETKEWHLVNLLNFSGQRLWLNPILQECCLVSPIQVHPDARGPVKKLGQQLKRGRQIEPYRLCYSFNGLLLIILIHLRSNKACRTRFGSPFLVFVSHFLNFLVWKPTALASGCCVYQR